MVLSTKTGLYMRPADKQGVSELYMVVGVHIFTQASRTETLVTSCRNIDYDNFCRVFVIKLDLSQVLFSPVVDDAMINISCKSGYGISAGLDQIILSRYSLFHNFSVSRKVTQIDFSLPFVQKDESDRIHLESKRKSDTYSNSFIFRTFPHLRDLHVMELQGKRGVALLSDSKHQIIVLDMENGEDVGGEVESEGCYNEDEIA